MALALDNDTHGEGDTDVLTVSHTVAGSDTVLLVFAYGRSSSVTFSGCTYNGVSMVEEYDATQQGLRFAMYSLIAPAAGANDVVLTGSFLTELSLHVVSLTGADQTDAVEAVANANGTTDPSVAITTITNNAWAVDGAISEDGNAKTVGAGQTELDTTVDGGGSWDTANSYEQKVTAGSVTMDWTGGDAAFHCGAMAVKPAAAAASSIKTVDTIAQTSVKTISGIAIASVKTKDTVANI